jgi:flotillin
VVKATGMAEADAQKARGLAQAAVIEAQGTAEAEAMRRKAASYQEYNQAAVIEMIMRALPEIAMRVAEPLGRMEKMVVINAGGVGGGASKVTADITNIMAQLPPVLEALTGVKFETLMEQVPALRKAMGKRSHRWKGRATSNVPMVGFEKRAIRAGR